MNLTKQLQNIRKERNPQSEQESDTPSDSEFNAAHKQIKSPTDVFVKVLDYVFRPHEVDWFQYVPEQQTMEFVVPAKTLVYCKGQVASVEDPDRALFNFLEAYTKPGTSKLDTSGESSESGGISVKVQTFKPATETNSVTFKP